MQNGADATRMIDSPEEAESLIWLRPRRHPGIELLHAQRSTRMWRTYTDFYGFGASLRVRSVDRPHCDWRYRNETHRLTVNGTALLEPGEAHVTQTATPDADYDVLRFDPDVFASLVRELGGTQTDAPHLKSPQVYDPEMLRSIRHVRVALMEEADAAPPPGDAAEAAVAQLVRLIVTRYVEGSTQESAPAPGRQIVRRARERLIDQWNQALSMQEVARELGISPYYLAHAFSHEVGMPPLQFQLQVRLARARRMLTSTTDSITDIGMRCGFADTSYFDRQFKRRVGVTPSLYRAAGR